MTAKVDATSLNRRDEAIALYEKYRDYTLMDALEGEHNHDMDDQAAAAFSMTDVETLRKLCKKRQCPVDFVEPEEALKLYPKPKTKPKDGKKPVEREFNLSERFEILRDHPGTRANAQQNLVRSYSGPFDA